MFDLPHLSVRDKKGIARAAGGGLVKPRALIVESDDLARRVVADRFTAAGFDVAIASCCDSAVAHVARHGAVDVLVAGTRLPEISGYELVDIMSKDFPDTRYIFLVRPCEKERGAPSLKMPFSVRDLQSLLVRLTDVDRGPDSS